MNDSVEVYTGDGSTLTKPKLGQKLWPVQYDPALNVWVTKDVFGLVQIIGAGTGSGILKTIDREFTAAQIKTIGSTPLEIIPQPGVGKVIHIISGLLQITDLLEPFTDAGSPVTLSLIANGLNFLTDTTLNFSTALSSTTNIIVQTSANVPVDINTITVVENASIFVVADVDSTLGDGTVTVHVQYVILDL